MGKVDVTRRERGLLKQLIRNFGAALKLPRWRAAVTVAVLSDAIGFGLMLVPPVQWMVDGLTAVVLLMVLGIRWPLFCALAVEVIPGLALFPAWTLVVLALAGSQRPSKPLGRGEIPG